jgi:cellulose synthase/poly-beta-1,6-N-acetylglucosamine synthase-like glycosyltransferase
MTKAPFSKVIDRNSIAQRPTAQCGPSRLQISVLVVTFCSLGLGLIVTPKGCWHLAHGAFAGLFLMAALIKLGSVGLAGAKPSAPVREHQPKASLPTYSILVPLYHEADMAGQIIAALKALSYPRDKLEALLVVEADDHETRRALHAARPPHWMRVVTVPDGQPRTKPRACNLALAQARGELVVVYDAEDRPHPDQLLESAAAFAKGGPSLGCLQAPLRIPNCRGFFARQFALDYAVQFETLLPALVRAGRPIPLGGTSNHLRTEVLRELGGWDPFNVTEDADLGFRLAFGGYRTGLLTLPTFETPTRSFAAWLPQRARWLKGYLQTLFVWTRAPGRLNIPDQVTLWITLGLSVLSALIHAPLMLWLLVQTGLAMAGHPASSWPMDLSVLALGWTTTATAMLVGAGRTGFKVKLSDLILSIAYWPLASLAAAKAIFQFIARPFHWDKTPHQPEALRTAL